MRLPASLIVRRAAGVRNVVVPRQASMSLLSRQSVRMASSSSSSTSTVQAAAEKVKSDAPWAIASLVVFGSMFVYVTAPPSKGGAGKPPHSHSEKSVAHTTDFDSEINKIEVKPTEDAPTGNKALAANSKSPEEAAHLQKPTKDAGDIRRPDDLTFKAGTAAAKEGHKDKDKVISDPKKVVADAHTARQDKKAKEQGDQPAEQGEDEEEGGEGEEESKEDKEE